MPWILLFIMAEALDSTAGWNICMSLAARTGDMACNESFLMKSRGVVTQEEQRSMDERQQQTVMRFASVHRNMDALAGS